MVPRCSQSVWVIRPCRARTRSPKQSLWPSQWHWCRQPFLRCLFSPRHIWKFGLALRQEAFLHVETISPISSLKFGIWSNRRFMVNCNVPRFKPPITPTPISQDATWWFQREIWSQATPAAISCRRDITSVDSRFKLSCGSKMVHSLTCYRWLQVISCCNSMICNLRNGFVEFDHHMQKVLTQRSINGGQCEQQKAVFFTNVVEDEEPIAQRFPKDFQICVVTMGAWSQDMASWQPGIPLGAAKWLVYPAEVPKIGCSYFVQSESLGLGVTIIEIKSYGFPDKPTLLAMTFSRCRAGFSAQWFSKMTHRLLDHVQDWSVWLSLMGIMKSNHHKSSAEFCSPQIATQFPSLPFTSFHFLSFNLQIRPFLSPAWSTIAISQPQGSTCFDQSLAWKPWRAWKAWVAWQWPRCFAFVESMENDFEMDYPSACYHALNI